MPLSVGALIDHMQLVELAAKTGARIVVPTGALLGLEDQWQQVDRIRILMGDEVSLRTRQAFAKGFAQVRGRLDASLEKEKEKNDFLAGVPAIVEAIRSG